MDLYESLMCVCVLHFTPYYTWHFIYHTAQQYISTFHTGDILLIPLSVLMHISPRRTRVFVNTQVQERISNKTKQIKMQKRKQFLDCVFQPTDWLNNWEGEWIIITFTQALKLLLNQYIKHYYEKKLNRNISCSTFWINTTHSRGNINVVYFPTYFPDFFFFLACDHGSDWEFFMLW